MYTPYIFNYGEIKFIPIEAVAAVVQCKSKYVAYNNVTEWRRSIERLFTSMDSVARMTNRLVDNETSGDNSSTQTATRPIYVLCAVTSKDALTKFNQDFDIVLSVNETDNRLEKYIRGEEKSLWEWNRTLNHSLKKIRAEDIELKKEKDRRRKIMIKPDASQKNQREKLLQDLKVTQLNNDGIEEENVLLSLIFQLNQLLMILNNPMLFPHHAYAKRFSDILKEAKEGKNDGKQK